MNSNNKAELIFIAIIAVVALMGSIVYSVTQSIPASQCAKMCNFKVKSFNESGSTVRCECE